MRGLVGEDCSSTTAFIMLVLSGRSYESTGDVAHNRWLHLVRAYGVASLTEPDICGGWNRL